MDGLWDVVDRSAPRRTRPSIAFIVAVAGTAVATLASAFTAALIGTSLPFLFGIAVVLASAALGGFWPGLLATVLMITTTVWRGGPNVSLPNVLVVSFFCVSIAAFGEVVLRLRWRAEAEAWRLSRREEYSQQLFHSLPAPVLVLSEDGRILTLNEAGAALFGYEPSDLKGRHLSDCIDLKGAGPVEAQLLDLIARQEMAGVLARGNAGDGEPMELALALTTGRLGDRRVLTLYVRNEAPRRRAAEEHATLLINVQQLGRAVALGQLGSAIAHELNQPLASAANYAGAARRALDDPAKAGVVEEAIDASLGQIFRASSLLTKLRRFVRAERPDLVWLDTRQVFEEALTLGGMAARQANASIELSIPDSFGELLVDRIQIQQVLLNLVKNAAEAVADQSRREIIIAASAAEPHQAIITVSDSGPGLSADQREVPFQPFSTSKANGIGVGLSISKAIVELHQGKLWYEQAPEGGARFAFSLSHRQAGELWDAA